MKAAKIIFAVVTLFGAYAVAPISVGAQTVDLIGNAHGLFLAPFFPQGSDESAHDAGDVSVLCGGEYDAYTDQGADVDAFRTFALHGVISVVSHGWVTPSGSVVIATGEHHPPTISCPGDAHCSDWQGGFIVPCSGTWDNATMVNRATGYWCVTPKFVGFWAVNLPQSLAYVDACYSYANSSMADAFTNNGAKTYFGARGSISSTAGYAYGTTLFDTLTDLSLDPDQRTTGKAASKAGSALTLGSTDQNLALQGGLINGGFETGNLTGWHTAFVAGDGPLAPEWVKVNGWVGACKDGTSDCLFPGPDPSPAYAIATRDNHAPWPTKGNNWSARIGRWTPNDHYSDQPWGDDQLYQDVQLGSGPANGGPSHFYLTFWYDMYSAGFGQSEGDYFYMAVEDPPGAAGKPAKVALTATMRKLLLILNAILKNRSQWNPICRVNA